MKLQSALELAANGLRVFPVEPNTKRPKAGMPWKEAATADPDRVQAWWKENPDFNIGIAAGAGLVVVDVDVKNEKPGLASLAMLDMLGLPESFRVETPSGGVHVYLKTLRSHANKVDSLPNYPGIDIKSDGGYVLGPGSTLDGKAYAALGEFGAVDAAPAWFESEIDTPTQRAANSNQPLVELDMPEALAKAKDWLENRAPEATLGAGSNNTTYSVAAELRAMGVSEPMALDLMLDHWNEQKSNPPWPPEKLERVVSHAFRYGQGAPGYKTAAGEFGALEIDVGKAPEGLTRQATETKAESEEKQAEKAAKELTAKPYIFADPITIPKREWLGGGKHFMRKFVSVTVAPGGIGKSSLTIAELLAMVSGKPLLGHEIEKPLTVWYWNLEDPYDELQRRIQAAIQHYGLPPDDIGDRLYVNSGRESALRIAIADKNGAKIVRPVVDAFTAEMIARRIDVASIDPFVSSHGVPENDNNGMDMVAKEWGRVADRANAAIDLVHHTRKMGGDEITSDSARGGVALVDASRSTRVLNRMTKEEAEKAGVENNRLYFRTYSDKLSMAPPADRSEWFKLESVALANGDDVGVVVPWVWPDPFQDITNDHVRRVQAALGERVWRANVQAKDEWVGVLVAEIAGLDLEVASEKERVKQMIRDWTEKKWLKVDKMRDEKGRERPVVVVGKHLQEDDFGPCE